MINQIRKSLIVILLLSCGCQLPWRKEPQFVEPLLSMQMSCVDLVDHLNSQHRGLESWRSNSTVMWVRLPNGVRQRLEGVIACRAPQYFRLTAENFIADADLGSNASRCWMYVHPGESAVLTWRHEDTSLLQQIPTGMPYIDPNWLMLVLGVKPLDAADYVVSPAPGGVNQLWLQAIEESPTGPLKRVIKVDTIRGVIREHAVFDHNSHPIVRAHLSDHKIHNGHRIPTKVQLEFPQLDSEISLTFRTIETNPYLSDDLWKLPSRNMQVVDLGKVVRHKMQMQQGQAVANQVYQPPGSVNSDSDSPHYVAQPQSAIGDSDSVFDGEGVFDDEATTSEPDWDQPISFQRAAPAPARQPPPTQPRRGIWSWFGR